jgi:flagellar biosynthesis protein FliR
MPELASAAQLAAFALVALRVLPAGLALCLLSRGLVPTWVGLGLGLALAAGLSAGLSLPSPAQGALGWWWIASAARELCLGLAFAIATAVPWLALGWGVRVAERPAQERAPLSALYLLSAALLVFALGGHRAYLGALADTLRDVPPGLAALDAGAFGDGVLAGVGSAFGLALSLGLPLWIALFLLDATLALSTRAAGGTGELSRSPLRAALALLILALLLAPFASRAPELVRASLRDARARVADVGN